MNNGGSVSGRGWRWLSGHLCHADLHVIYSALEFIKQVFESLYALSQILDVALVGKRYFLGLGMCRGELGEILRRLETGFLEGVNLSLEASHCLLEFVLVEGCNDTTTT